MSKVLYEKRGEVAYITLNRPEAMNAIDLETHQLLQKTWADFRDDTNLRAAIITGAGDEAFCGGADLKTHVPQWLGVPGMHPMGARGKVRDGLGGLTRGMHRIYKPVIAAVNGWALAGGFETALAADIRIASENAKFGSFEIAPKKTYLSLRRIKQFAMIGPATNTQVEVGLNVKGLKAAGRL